MSVRRRSRNLIVSSTHRSSPHNAFSIESRIFDSRISLLIESELRQSVDKRPVSVDMDTVTVGGGGAAVGVDLLVSPDVVDW